MEFFTFKCLSLPSFLPTFDFFISMLYLCTVAEGSGQPPHPSSGHAPAPTPAAGAPVPTPAPTRPSPSVNTTSLGRSAVPSTQPMGHHAQSTVTTHSQRGNVPAVKKTVSVLSFRFSVC